MPFFYGENMSAKLNTRFHLAININDLEESVNFYCGLLGCQLGDFEEGKWQDVNFWGHELTLHKSDSKIKREAHPVDMGQVCVPHFGIHLDSEIYDEVKKKISNQDKYRYFDDPYIRFNNKPREQETFFIEDPSGNMLEIKTMKNPDSLFS